MNFTSDRARQLKLGFCLAVATTLLGGCAGLVSKATDRMATNLGNAVLNQDDPATVRDGLPAYLLLLDGLLEGSPDSPALLASSSRMYSSYAGGFVHDNIRAKRLSKKALDRAWKALCIKPGEVCALKDLGFEEFADAAARLDDGQIEGAYLLGSAWATYIQARRDDWVAIADIPKVDSLLQRVAARRPDIDHGMAWVYLGVLNSLRPAAVGGEPEKVTVQHCLISFAGRGTQATRSQEEAESLAADILSRANAGEDFEKLVREYSDDPPREPNPGVYAMTNKGCVDVDSERKQFEVGREFQKIQQDLAQQVREGKLDQAAYQTQLMAKRDELLATMGEQVYKREGMAPAFGDVSFSLP